MHTKTEQTLVGIAGGDRRVGIALPYLVFGGTLAMIVRFTEAVVENRHRHPSPNNVKNAPLHDTHMLTHLKQCTGGELKGQPRGVPRDAHQQQGRDPGPGKCMGLRTLS
jgi:hypothetical protein